MKLLRRHREAIEYELLERGMHLDDVGTKRLTWREFLILVRGWLGQPHNMLAEAEAGHSLWTVGEQLTAMVVDLVNVGNYYIAKANGAKNLKRPKPIDRPWDSKPVTYGRDPVSIEEIDQWMKDTIREV